MNWDVRVNPSNPGLLEDSCDRINYVECDEQTQRVRTYYHYWRHHEFYRINHRSGVLPKNKNPKIDNFINTILEFINNGELLYALTVVDIVSVLVDRAIIHNSFIKATPCRVKTDWIYLRGSKNALSLFKEYLELDKRFVQNVINPSGTVSLYADITKELFYKIDGAKALAREIGVDNFIQYAIDQCYFFEPKIVNDRMNDICDCVKSILYLYARKSTSFFMNTTVYNINSHGKYGQIGDGLNYATFKSHVNSENLSRIVLGLKEIIVNSDTKHRLFTDPDPTYNITNYPIILDTDGNQELRSIINVDYTGYTISSGKDSIFQNYRLSHIWGRAYDPRFFTNLWNVVLVPAWANDLLDKPNPVEGSLESKLKSTIQRICEVLYFGGIKNWSSINIPQPSVINGGNDVVRPKSMANGVALKNIINKENATNNKNAPKNPLPYLINIIEDKGNKTLGDIVKYAVYI